MDSSKPKRRKTAPDPCDETGASSSRGDTRDGIDAILKEHSRQIETLVAANVELTDMCRSLDVKYQAQVDELKAECREKCEALGRARDDLEARCSSLERSIQVLKKDVNWTYSAPEIPRSHWIEQGHDDEYANNMEEFLEGIKEDVKDMRNAGDETNKFRCTCLDNEGFLAVSHDDVLLPHFKELADAIQLSRGIHWIVFDNIELHPSALKILGPALENKVARIYMQHITFPTADVMKCYKSITTLIGRNRKLKYLLWSNIEFPSEMQADLFIESIAHNKSIKGVRLADCFNQGDVNGCRALALLMTSGRPFEVLDFDRNGLSGIDGVAAALATNPQIITLGMIGNELSDRDAELIAQALKRNTNLQKLFLEENNVTDAGFERIRTAIYDASSLNAMGSCNHTCWVDRVEGNFDAGPQHCRRRKLYQLLSTRQADGSNTRHMDTELGKDACTMKLLPRVLECIERCYSDRKLDTPMPLSLFFELIKDWKMPELFDLGGIQMHE